MSLLQERIPRSSFPSNPSSLPVTFLTMLPYLPTAPSTPEPEGWDAAHVLQLVNPISGRWSCPTATKRNRRCENVVSQQRSAQVTVIVNTMSVEDAGVVARDNDRELTGLAETMLCPLHSRAIDTKEKVRAVVAQWKNCIKTSVRQQAQPRPLHANARTPTIEYQPTNGLRNRHLGELPDPKAPVPLQAQPRAQKTAFDVSPSPQDSPPSYGATIDRAAAEEVMKAFQNLTLQNHQLREQNRTLREQNSQLAEQRDAAAGESKRARGQLEAAERERDALDGQVDGQVGEQYREINSLRDREAAQLEKISTLQDTLQKTSGAYRRLKKIWTAESVVPKGKA